MTVGDKHELEDFCVWRIQQLGAGNPDRYYHYKNQKLPVLPQAKRFVSGRKIIAPAANATCNHHQDGLESMLILCFMLACH
jgi:hypothetical protein